MMQENFQDERPDADVDEKFEEITSFRALRYFIKRDYCNIHGKFTLFGIVNCLLFEPGFKFVFWLRITRYFFLKGKKAVIPFFLSRLMQKHYSYKYEFDVTYRTPIGPGLSIAHIGYVICAAARIGSNCHFRPGMVIGAHLTIDEKNPVIGDNVQFGVGCKVLGNVTIGNNVVIGANAVVTHDVPSNTVVAGVPARIINTLDHVVR